MILTVLIMNLYIVIFKVVLILLFGAAVLVGIAAAIREIIQEDDDFLTQYGTRFDFYNKNNYENGKRSI